MRQPVGVGRVRRASENGGAARAQRRKHGLDAREGLGVAALHQLVEHLGAMGQALLKLGAAALQVQVLFAQLKNQLHKLVAV